MTYADLKSLIAAFFRKRDGTITPVSDFVINGVDTLDLSINSAMRKAEMAVDLEYSMVEGLLSIATTGSSIANTTLLDATTSVTVKRVQHVELPVAGSQYIPCEFLDDVTAADRIKRQVGRTIYDPALTLADYGVSDDSPYAVQQGQMISLLPAEMFSFPVVVKLNLVKFLANLTIGSSNFILENGAAYLQWQGIVETNKIWQNFVTDRQEGIVNEDACEAQADKALQAFLMWNASIRQGTTATDTQGQPPKPQQNG